MLPLAGQLTVCPHAAAAEHLACIQTALLEQLLSSLTLNVALHASADYVMPCVLWPSVISKCYDR